MNLIWSKNLVEPEAELAGMTLISLHRNIATAFIITSATITHKQAQLNV